MNRLHCLIALMLLLIAWTGCKPAYRGPQIVKPPPIQVLSNYGPGDEVQTVIDNFGLRIEEMRERKGRPDGEVSMIYFLEQGNLHIEAKRTPKDRLVLRAKPFLEPAKGSISERVAKWDSAVEPENTPEFKHNR